MGAKEQDVYYKSMPDDRYRKQQETVGRLRAATQLGGDEMQILDACITGWTAGEIAAWCAFSISKTRRLLKKLERQQLVRRSEIVMKDGAKPIVVWTREGPCD